jgi:PAS domain S-box-containing protein
VERLVSRLAAAIALVVSLAPPLLFSWDDYNMGGARLEAEAASMAKALTGFVARNPTAWQLPTDRLQALVLESRSVAGATRVTELGGRVIVSVGEPAAWPVLTRSAEFHDFGSPVGEVEVEMSARGSLYRSAAVLAVSVVLGLLIYGPMRRIPLRAIHAATRELEASEARYRQLVERAPVGIVKHHHGTIEFVNPAFVTLVGAASAEEVVGRDFLRFVVPEQRGEATGMIVELASGAASLPFRTLRLLRRDGGVVESEVAGVANREGSPGAAQFIVLDLTDQRLAQEVVRRSRDQLLDHQRALAAIARSKPFAAGDSDAAVRTLTEVAAKQLGVERVGLWRFTEARDAIRCVDLYERSRDRHGDGAVVPAQPYPRYFEAISGEEAIVADDAVNDELTRELADDYLRPHGISSMLDVPVRLRGMPEGVLCHEHVGPPICWTLEQRMFATALGNLAALALEQGARRQAEDEARALTVALERHVREQAEPEGRGQ